MKRAQASTTMDSGNGASGVAGNRYSENILVVLALGFEAGNVFQRLALTLFTAHRRNRRSQL